MKQILPVSNPVTSYWLSQPHKYSNLRSTQDLPKECDIAILGSGMAGVTTAYHIFKQAETAPHIVLLEARQLCSGATARNGGHSKIKLSTLASQVPKLGSDGVDELQAFVQGVIANLKQVVEDEELDCELEIRRSFDVQLDNTELASLKEIFDKSRKAGHMWTKDVGFALPQFLEQVTSIRGAQSAESVPCASLWPYKFVTQLLERLLNVQTMTPVTLISVLPDGRNAITTPRGVLKAKNLVFATNAYTAGLLPQFKDVIVPVRGMATHIVPKVPVHPHLSHTYNITFRSGQSADYLNPRPDGSIVVGGGGPAFKSDRPSWFNNFDDSTRFSSEVEQYWEKYMQRNFLGWEDSQAEPELVWTGIMGATPDSWPHVGRVPGRENEWVLAGFNGGGMSFIPTVAKAIAKMVIEGSDFDDVKADFGMPDIFATSTERLREAFAETQ
ncbi:FAD dependent oxidoreductase [Bimuria novae-zelandiae CBS 107.79]|uniref:FAD dependent oxidoreductase n=1 Tax=Bimuria novae-zelandiae CBS 107.79 TaxID=1447943 RepID=A0A6A5V2A9_9PLEO|nr:FAD dependent oxidoreductase [Bimuria novae-zelandiae CBS 107.79]